MREPIGPARRVPGVDVVANGTGETPPLRHSAGAPAGEIAIVAIPMTFVDFYRDQRVPVARALAVTLNERALAEEAADEAMTRAYQHWKKVSGLDNPGGWVYRVGLNWACSFLRRRKRAEPPAPGHGVSEQPSPAEPAVIAALKVLPVDQRAVVVCRYLLGFSERETAAALGIRPGTAKSRTARALSRLRDELDHLAPEGYR